MSSSVCQGLQSWLELRHIKSRPLRLKLDPPKTIFPASSVAPPTESYTPVKDAIDDCEPMANQNVDTGGWSFLQSLANTDYSNSARNDKVYVHPLVKRSASTLSERSLEMCTESLGCETGSEASESIDHISLLSLENGVYNSTSTRKKTSRVSSFPPPLTSISGSNGVKVKSHREGGRLVLQAVTIPTCTSYFHTERSEGRLRLSLLKDAGGGGASEIFEDEDDKEEYQEEVVEKDNGDGEVKDEERLVRKVETWNGMVGLLGPTSETEGRRHEGLFHWQPLLVG
ncbi:hypothetical protein V6N13_004637 [Hibiscus sabdariffa]|uniref:FAF domain-containing protein n=1 Tax=Hibiscus sabdariffa TaxID=183260 RepID=A0ABR2RZ43_9ROSI